VRFQVEALLAQTQDDLPTVARGINVEPEWAAGIMDGSITEVDVDHVQRLCEGLHCTPYDFWDAEAGRSIVHAYGPELWPRWIEPLVEPPGPGLGGPELGL
jgi:DNA-binding Xre family transcriptional regulator